MFQNDMVNKKLVGERSWCVGAKVNVKQLELPFVGGVASLLLLRRIANTACPNLHKFRFLSVRMWLHCRHRMTGNLLISAACAAKYNTKPLYWCSCWGKKSGRVTLC